MGFLEVVGSLLFFASLVLLVISLVSKIRKKPAKIWIKRAIISFVLAMVVLGFNVSFLGGIAVIFFFMGLYGLAKIIQLLVKKKDGKKKFAILMVIGFVGYSIFDSSFLLNATYNKSAEKVANAKQEEKKEDKKEKVTYKKYGIEEIKSMLTVGMTKEDFSNKKEEASLNNRSFKDYEGYSIYTFNSSEGQIAAVVLNKTAVTKIEVFDNEDSIANFIKEEEVRIKEEQRIIKEKEQEELKKKLEESYNNSKQKLEGSGDSVTSKINLNSGLAFFEFTNQGSRNFIVHLKDSSGTATQLLVNTIGSYKGTVQTTIPSSGEYYLEVKSSGGWSSSVTQKASPNAEKAPGTVSGHGDDVVFIEVPSGNHIIKLKHTGSRNFIIKVNDKNLLVNKIGSYEGSASQVFQDTGMYSFGVKADGDWSITIE
ncbi:tripartite tricarboxylate transporter TctB family protein [Bacillus cereus]|nr:tripartite tricarboxylate transporter TctB family protein [Bacillus cereus]